MRFKVLDMYEGQNLYANIAEQTINVTGFTKTDCIVTFCILRNTNLKYLKSL